MFNLNVNKVTVVPPQRPLVGRLRLPGSKSVTNRALLLSSLAAGTSRLSGALASDDTRHMAEALRLMGVRVHQTDGDAPGEVAFEVESDGRLIPPAHPLFLGNAGTAMRFLVAAAALARGTVVLDGDEHMRCRPIGPLVAALRRLGVEASAVAGCPPVTVHGSGSFSQTMISVDASQSSQFVSGILMAAACGSAPIDVLLLEEAEIGGRGYIDLTYKVMEAFGAHIEKIGSSRWRVHPSGYAAREYHVEPDASAATYLWAAERLTGGMIDLGVEPAQMAQPDALAHAIIGSFPHLPAVIDGAQIQDAIPTLAVLAAFNNSPVRFKGIANLRIKECDRVAALATEISRLAPGLAIEDGDDLLVSGDPSLSGRRIPTEITTYGDHRIAMALALAGLRIDGITILDPGCVRKTYPQYWSDLGQLGVSFEGA